MLSSQSEGLSSPTVLYDDKSDQSTSHISETFSSKSTPLKCKHRPRFNYAILKMQKSAIRDDKQDEVIWGVKTKNGYSSHPTMFREALPSGGIGEETDPNKFFKVSCVFFVHCCVFVLLLSQPGCLYISGEPSAQRQRQ